MDCPFTKEELEKNIDTCEMGERSKRYAIKFFGLKGKKPQTFAQIAAEENRTHPAIRTGVINALRAMTSKDFREKYKKEKREAFKLKLTRRITDRMQKINVLQNEVHRLKSQIEAIQQELKDFLSTT